MNRITVVLSDSELAALVHLAQRERRYPRDQAAFLLRQSLLAEGALKELEGSQLTCMQSVEVQHGRPSQAA